MKSHIYPGMGATAAMYPEEWRELISSRFHNWPRWSGEKTIEDIAARIIDEHGIVAGDKVIGSSLGGIVACEVANQIELSDLVLIGSAVSQSEVSGLLKLLHPLVDMTPMRWIQFSSGKIPHDLSVMFADSDPEFIRHMCKAIFTWDGLNASVPLTRIHGRKDHIIPPSESVDYLIDGGHLIAMTHAREVMDSLPLLS